eukprot:4192505-Amphidinium_carterae.1
MAPALLAPKVRKVKLSTHLARLPVTVQASGKGIEHDNTSMWSFHTRRLRARLPRLNLGGLSVLGRRRQPCARPGF